jgi:hypothetical protein
MREREAPARYRIAVACVRCLKEYPIELGVDRRREQPGSFGLAVDGLQAFIPRTIEDTQHDGSGREAAGTEAIDMVRETRESVAAAGGEGSGQPGIAKWQRIRFRNEPAGGPAPT